MRWALPLLIVVVFVAAIVASLMPNPKATAEGCPGFCPNLGLDLVGGLRGEYQIIATDNQAVTPEILNQTRTIIENRVNATGVAEPNVQTQGGDRITVELPGAADADEIRNLVGTTGRLDFVAVPNQYANAIVEGQPLPVGMDPTPIFSGDQISAARPGTDQVGQLAVDIELKGQRRRPVRRLCRGALRRAVRDRPRRQGHRRRRPSTRPASTAAPRSAAASRPEEMNNLVTVLKFGSLPLEIQEVGFSSLSATLGLGFLAQTVLAGLIGIGFVFAFMLINYRLPGVIACIALLFYTLINYALFRAIPVTLTLAGIAGFVLSVGMAVDANILIFERTKEELRAGKPLAAAIEAGFNRAWNSIFDSNVSTLMTAFILWYFGSSTVKGFALVLIIGVLTSMFTAITLSRMMLRWVVRQQWARKASYYGVHEDEFVVTAPPSRGPEARPRARV